MTPEEEIKNPFAIEGTSETSVSDVTPSAASEPVSADPGAVADGVEKKVEEALGEDLEDDGDVFWMIQRIVWSIVKSVVIIGGIALILWLVWGDGSWSLPKISWFEKSTEAPAKPKVEKPEETKKPAEKPAEPVVTPTIEPTFYEGIEAVRWNFWLYRNYRAQVGDPLESGLLWLRDVEDFFQVPMLARIPAQAPEQRAQQVGYLLQDLDDFITQDRKIRGFLLQQMAEFRIDSEDSAALEAGIESELIASLDARRGENISKLLSRKIQAGNQKYTADNRLWVRGVIVEKMEEYEAYLQRVKGILLTNQASIIQNIQVVEFPDDPFERVLQP